MRQFVEIAVGPYSNVEGACGSTHLSTRDSCQEKTGDCGAKPMPWMLEHAAYGYTMRHQS